MRNLLNIFRYIVMLAALHFMSGVSLAHNTTHWRNKEVSFHNLKYDRSILSNRYLIKKTCKLYKKYPFRTDSSIVFNRSVFDNSRKIKMLVFGVIGVNDIYVVYEYDLNGRNLDYYYFSSFS